VVYRISYFWVQWALTLEAKRQGFESDHSLPSNAKVSKAGIVRIM
jgi:hypothetical protein